MSVTLSGSGQIPVQVVQTVKTDTFSTTSTSFVDVTGLSVNITPTNSSNKILVMYQFLVTADPANAGVGVRLVRNSTPIFIGDAASTRPQVTNGGSSLNNFCWIPMAGSFVDSPSTTSAVTYKIQIFNSSGTTSFVNRTQNDRDISVADARGASSIIVMEISG